MSGGARGITALEQYIGHNSRSRHPLDLWEVRGIPEFNSAFPYISTFFVTVPEIELFLF